MEKRDSYEFCADCEKGCNYQFGQYLTCECPREGGAKVIVNPVGCRYVSDTVFDNIMNLKRVCKELFEGDD